HQVVEPGEDELKAVFRQLGCLGVRFAAPLQGSGKLSYQIVCDNPQYGLETLSANVRSKVRRGLRRCNVEPVPLSLIATNGRRAHSDTVARQGRGGVLDGDEWDRFFAAASATPGIEGWGAWVGTTLAAFLVTVTFDHSVEFLLARSCSDELTAYPNNALLFQVAQEMLCGRGVPEITFGLESL